MTKITTRQGLIALSPIFVLIGLFLTLSIAWGDFDKVPLVVVFVIASAYALFITNRIMLRKWRWRRTINRANFLLPTVLWSLAVVRG